MRLAACRVGAHACNADARPDNAAVPIPVCAMTPTRGTPISLRISADLRLLIEVRYHLDHVAT